MRKALLLILFAIPISLFAQNQYLIIGEIKNIQAPAKVYLYYRQPGQRSHIDSTVVKNGKFEFKGIIADTVLAEIYVDYKGINLDDIWGKNNTDSKSIYLTKGATYLTGNDSACNAELSGTKINADEYKYTTLLKTVSSDSIKAILDKEFIRKNHDSYVSLDQALNDLDKMGINVDELEPMFNSLTANVRSGKEAFSLRII